MHPTHPRWRALNRQRIPAQASYVLVWVQQCFRGHDNPLLDTAIAYANEQRLPVVVYHGLRHDYPYASYRFHSFILRAVHQLEQTLRARGVRMVRFVATPRHTGRGLLYALAEDAQLVLTDDHFTFVPRDQAARFAERVARPVIAVDCSRLVPTQALPEDLAGTRQFRSVHTSRRAHWLDEVRLIDAAPSEPWFSGDLATGLASAHGVEPPPAHGPEFEVHLAATLAACGVDPSVEHHPFFDPSALQARLAALATRVLPRYAADRNNPSIVYGVSNLSPYLRFGLLGPHTLCDTVRGSAAPAYHQRKFLDEALTWREWSHYVAFHTRHVERYGQLDETWREALERHRDDAREHHYDLPTLMHGQTHDETWNAAQKQWLLTGWMHNNLRMYWATQLLAFTADPLTAWQTACYLNDKLAYDGRDPATYVSLRWAFGAGSRFRERPVYGPAPRKRDAALRQRRGVKEWLAHVAQLPVPTVETADWAARREDYR